MSRFHFCSNLDMAKFRSSNLNMSRCHFPPTPFAKNPPAPNPPTLSPQRNIERKSECLSSRTSIYDAGLEGPPSPPRIRVGTFPPCGVVDGVVGIRGLRMDWRTGWVCDWLAGGLIEILFKMWETLLPSICTQHKALKCDNNIISSSVE